ncbi:MAG: hypothetical protein COA65_02050 [Rhodospirillaceae bacterium]|nr:MAG: hypothetical protein COA65_02050 [Rhodospirillaceae bacterium]
MRVLNLGCGSKTSSRCINIDWSPYLRVKKNKLLRVLVAPFLNEERRHRLIMLSDNVMAWNLRKGIPFPDESVDAVYHSHILEHIDRKDVASFQKEIYRVLKSGGTQRICVPNLEALARDYLSSLERCRVDETALDHHDNCIAEMIEQCVRREPFGTQHQPPVRRYLENLILGDARKRGETHQWMYDECNLKFILRQAGFHGIAIRRFNESNIPDWQSFGLEVDEEGNEYKPGSLYVDCMK